MSDESDEKKEAEPQQTQTRLRWMVPRFALALISAGGVFEAWLHSGHSVNSAAIFGTLMALGILRVTSRLQRGRNGGRLARKMERATLRGPSIGLGVTIGPGAKVAPGAIIEMGADIGAGAVIESGAVVRMGASIAADAVIESGAVISWGADVKRGARVQSGARVGAGATVGRGAVVPKDLWLKPGADFNGGGDRDRAKGASESADAGKSERMQASARAPAEPILLPPDPRQVKMDAVFTRIDTELAASPPLVREHLQSQTRGLAQLRTTCKTLLEREISLRAEASPDSLARLDMERLTLAEKIAATDDEPVRFSLSQAVSAIEEQKRQRQMLARNADRLDAELTRLFWTLDALAAQLVRMRSADAEASLTTGPDAELTKSMLQLQSEIDAIADAMEQVAQDDRAPARELQMSEPPPGAGEGETSAAQNSQREQG